MKYIEVEIDIKLMDLSNYVNISRETKTMQDMIAGLNVEINNMHGDSIKFMEISTPAEIACTDCFKSWRHSLTLLFKHWKK